VTKGSLLYAGASASANFPYCAGFGYFGAEDTAEAYATDILASGHDLADPALALRLAEEAGREADTVERWGVRWKRDQDDTARSPRWRWLPRRICFAEPGPMRPDHHAVLRRPAGSSVFGQSRGRGRRIFL
jgi:succinate dehydrogenase/fumarate reductase flavoprotein subunit